MVETAATGAKRARKLGKGRGAHIGVGEGVSGLGEVLAAANRPEMARVPEVEGEGEGGDAGPPAMRGSVGRTRKSRRR